MSVKDLTTYEVLKDEDLKGIKAKGKLLKHKKSGARVLLVENDDNNKVFSIEFRTPPSDSTGVPHIMEHSVLCGSKNFPAKDPFVELVKGSLNTFLNAMTYPDKTVYPVASCNDKDFQNLMHVYMDAVLYPNIYNHDKTFRQEGWSYKLDEKDGELSYNGVVYNEMKGAFSSPEGVLDRVVLNTLFPDNCYANESGGDPEVIPQLTYEQFLDFHRTYYHPSNSYIYLYGDMDMEEKLRWLDEEYLCHYDKKDVNSEIHLQKPFDEVQEKTFEYSIASDESEADNTYLSYNVVIGTSTDPVSYLALQILDYALIMAVEKMWDSGIVVVAAAGNNGPGNTSVTAPGISKKIITVGAFDDKNFFSGRGPTRECIVKPEVVVTGSNIIACNNHQGRYSSKSGTSMAAPVVSGAVARLIKNNPDITPKEVKIWMKSCCKKINVPSEKQGWGVLDIRKFVTG